MRTRGASNAESRASRKWQRKAPQTRRLEPQVRQARTTVPVQPAEEEPGIWGPVWTTTVSLCQAISLVEALPVPLDASLEKDCTLSPIGLQLGSLPGGCEVSTDLLREGPLSRPIPSMSLEGGGCAVFPRGAWIEAGFWNYIQPADAKQQEDGYEIFVCRAKVIHHYIVCAWHACSLRRLALPLTQLCQHCLLGGLAAVSTLRDTGSGSWQDVQLLRPPRGPALLLSPAPSSSGVGAAKKILSFCIPSTGHAAVMFHFSRTRWQKSRNI